MTLAVEVSPSAADSDAQAGDTAVAKTQVVTINPLAPIIGTVTWLALTLPSVD